MSKNFFDAVSKLQQPNGKVEYRLYYNSDNGEPLFYSCDNLPGSYIVVDAETYARGQYNIQIKQGKIHQLDKFKYIKLVPGNNGIPTHISNVMIIDPTSELKWSKKQYAS